MNAFGIIDIENWKDSNKKIIFLKDWERFKKGDKCILYPVISPRGDYKNRLVIYYEGIEETYIRKFIDLKVDYKKNNFECKELDSTKDIYWKFEEW